MSNKRSASSELERADKLQRTLLGSLSKTLEALEKGDWDQVSALHTSIESTLAQLSDLPLTVDEIPSLSFDDAKHPEPFAFLVKKRKRPKGVLIERNLVTHKKVGRHYNPRGIYNNKTIKIYKGVRQPHNPEYPRWRASISHDSKEYYLGTFASEKDAAAAYNIASHELHNLAEVNKGIEPIHYENARTTMKRPWVT